MTARSHMPAAPGCQRGLVFYGPVQGEKAMTTVIRGIVGGPYHPPVWRCHGTEAKQVAMTGQLMATILAHTWRESSGTVAQDCRCEGCIRHRLTLAHHDRPKPHASSAKLPEGFGLLWASPRGKSYDNSHQGHRGWALSSTFVALSQHGLGI